MIYLSIILITLVVELQAFGYPPIEIKPDPGVCDSSKVKFAIEPGLSDPKTKTNKNLIISITNKGDTECNLVYYSCSYELNFKIISLIKGVNLSIKKDAMCFKNHPQRHVFIPEEKKVFSLSLNVSKNVKIGQKLKAIIELHSMSHIKLPSTIFKSEPLTFIYR